ncbi:hypothetical protein MC67_09260 [Enterobacter cloacae complex sp.]|nr:hypothetical protein MC67_09260 [Enterobacter cloacae complex sp.]
MMSLWDALRMNMMISYQELVRTFPNNMLELLLYGAMTRFRVACFNIMIRYQFGVLSCRLAATTPTTDVKRFWNVLIWIFRQASPML